VPVDLLYYFQREMPRWGVCFGIWENIALASELTNWVPVAHIVHFGGSSSVRFCGPITPFQVGKRGGSIDRIKKRFARRIRKEGGRESHDRVGILEVSTFPISGSDGWLRLTIPCARAR